jgi:hypothetical protein
MASHIVYDAIKAHLTTAAIIAVLADPITTDVPPFRWENEAFTIPAGSWVDVEMTGTLYGQESVGAPVQSDNRWDEEGVLWLHALVPRDTGGREARRLCKEMADIFRGLTLLSGSLEFRDAFIGRGMPGDEDGNWFKIILNIEWRRIDA